ncbi:MAG: sulfotransferase domain-containing protein [Deltaproteobacteria bacterium]|nr:sulfotransferase domain-containing protein [Deltaproteobacteria bacterium]
MDSIWKKASREVLMALLFFLPVARRIRIERWLRGREEAGRLAEADVAVVSFGKSGRTWLRVMISRYYQLVYGIPERVLLGFSNYHRRNVEIPKIFFTHDNYIKDYTGEVDSKASFYGKKVVLLVRNPKDIAVSQYFQWQHRMRPVKKRLNNYPPHGAEVSPYQFVMDPDCGLPQIIAYLNLWAREAAKVESLLIVRYEDMRARPEETFARVMDFVNGRASRADAITASVEYASVENMRKLEEKNTFWLAGGRMKPGKKGDPNSYKVRRAKVGGYKDYFDEAQAAEIDEYVRKELSPAFGYDAPTPA